METIGMSYATAIQIAKNLLDQIDEKEFTQILSILFPGAEQTRNNYTGLLSYIIPNNERNFQRFGTTIFALLGQLERKEI